MKRFLALFLILATLVGLMPGIFAAEDPHKSDTTPLTEEDFILADLMWEEVNAKEESMLAKKAPTSKTVDALITTVTQSPYYEEDSLIRNGDHFFWETIDGIACGYSPRLSARARSAKAPVNYAPTPATVTYNYGTRAGGPGAKDVYVIQPYYGIDSDFTTQYVTEAQNIAQSLGGSATVYRTTNATIDTIADAMEQGGVVIFDSHGDTDYVNPDDRNDFASRANTSYICLQYVTGITAADMEIVSGPFGPYYHAYYAGSYGEVQYYCVDGTAIANHMEKTAPNSLLWTALCLGMTTDGLHKPLMEKGVAVTFGYSQSVTFEYDYKWEEVFWDEMIAGKTVAESIATMKSKVGLWDWCHARDYDTIEEARNEYCAFPIVVSAEDVYPGHGNVDDLQTVNSTWTLHFTCAHINLSYHPETAPTCATSGNMAYYQCDTCQSYFADAGLTTPLTWDMIAVPVADHNYQTVTVSPTCTAEGYSANICTVCGHTLVVSSMPPADHIYENGACVLCGKPDLPENPFTDVKDKDYFYSPVLWALKSEITTGTSATTFGPEKTCTRAQVVTFLWRAAGSPEPTTTENPFSDVRSKDYFYKAVLWAVENNITQGTGKGKFSPDNGCTRGQVATFLWRTQGNPVPTTSENPFSDVEEGSYYYNAVLWAVENNITQGTGKGKFSPDNSCTRGQIVTFLYRTLAQEQQ